MSSWLYEEYELYFPQYASMTEDWYEESEWDLVAKLSDGSRLIFDGHIHTIRSLPNTNNIDERQLRIEFSKRLFKMLNRRGITQLELSQITGISPMAISKYINRKATPSLHNANKIARALGCSTDDLILVYKKDWD